MESPIALIVRFATSIPDVALTIPTPSTTSIGNVKRQIRTHLPDEERKHGLRLIHSGRILEDKLSLYTALQLGNRPILQHQVASEEAGGDHDEHVNKGKGKQRAAAADTPPVYVHCAISSFALTSADLESELAPASDLGSQGKLKSGSRGGLHEASTTPQLRGFDRLLQNAGFTRADVAELRAQHTAIIANRHTPDTMPNQQALYELEEAWLDAGPGSGLLGSAQSPASATSMPRTSEEEDEQARVLTDTLYGAMMGFFWPIGALTWGFREDGIWSKRRKEMVLMGLILNVVFGVMSLLSF